MEPEIKNEIILQYKFDGDGEWVDDLPSPKLNIIMAKERKKLKEEKFYFETEWRIITRTTIDKPIE